MEQEILKIENLYFDYSDTSVLRDVNFTLHKGDFLGIIGANGAGRSNSNFKYTKNNFKNFAVQQG